MKQLRKFIAGIILVFATILSLLLVTAAYARYISPLHFAFPALLGLTFPIIAVVTVLFLILLLLIYPKYALLPFLALATAAPALWQYCPINLGKDRIDTNRSSFTLLSYNVLYFNDSKKEKLKDNLPYNPTLQTIIDYNADVVALQESRDLAKRNKNLKITQEQIEKIKQSYPYKHLNNGCMLLSKYPIKVLHDTAFSKTAFSSIYQIDIEGKQITLANNHLQSIGLNKDDKELYKEIATHPDSISDKIYEIKGFTKKFLHAFEARAEQVATVDSIMRETGSNAILCGDINDTPNSYAYHVLKKGRNDAFLQLGSGPGFTYRADGMWVRIDHILYEGDFVATEMQKGNKRYSDHYPLWVKFEWR